MNTPQSLLWKRIALAGLTAAAFAFGTTAVAGECPANQRVADGKGQKPGPTAPKDVTDKIIAMMQQFRADPRADKIDLGVGVYKDDKGRTPVMRAVKAAERDDRERGL